MARSARSRRPLRKTRRLARREAHAVACGGVCTPWRHGPGTRRTWLLDNAAADDARATILERSNDWPAAQKALTALVARTVPVDGKLVDGQRRTLLRLATAAARAGDEAVLSMLRRREAAQMETVRWQTCSGC